jgi:hypothetical protein
MVDSKESFLDFAARIAGRELTDFEKETLGTIYECHKSGNRLLIIPARYQGRNFALSLIKIFEEEIK